MRNRRHAVLIIGLALLAAVLFWLRTEPAAPKPAWVDPPRQSAANADQTGADAPRLAQLAREISPDAISPIAAELNAPNGTIDRDLELLAQVFEAWQTNFPHDGNPVGENAEITAALAGDNPHRFAFIAPTHRALNAQGELCDRWGTPFRLHQLSGTQMQLWSAGPDRRFGTADDVKR